MLPHTGRFSISPYEMERRHGYSQEVVVGMTTFAPCKLTSESTEKVFLEMTFRRWHLSDFSVWSLETSFARLVRFGDSKPSPLLGRAASCTGRRRREGTLLPSSFVA